MRARSGRPKKRRSRRILVLGTVGALAFGASVAALASATAPLAAKAADCSSGVVFTRSDSPAAVGDNPRHVVAGDLDGDGNTDVVAADNDADSLSVLLGNGDGTFGTATTYAVGDKPYQSVIADFDADGNPDIATADSATSRSTPASPDSVSVFQGTSGGELTGPSELAADGAYEATAADLTSDGTQDLVVASSGSDQLDIFTGSCG
ncbi:VCBS repeat-containing protein [Streptomyces asoensis]|uniref:VCBS repeat-containing protein n=1 Tax=Streptomyces asoensis TaxID=249586 RepID=A0A6M4X1N6_9ACTN|nr:VCBS repeat-containing protein [Streptomyces asoensis]QJT06169.1 VCBS repeat-containing protein [Streptomyces asoensis]